MANRYRERSQGQQGYSDNGQSRYGRQDEQFDQQSSRQYGDDYDYGHDDRGSRMDNAGSYGQSRADRNFGRDFESERGFGGSDYRRSGAYDPLAAYDRQQSRSRASYGGSGRDRDFSQSYGSNTSNRSNYGQGDYAPDERRSDDRGFFDKAGDEVASWFGDDDAERRREMDYRRQQDEHANRGQSHRGRGPKNYSRTDDRILEDACDHLTHDHGVDASELEVTVKSGELTLDGKVNSRWEKRRAEDCVHDISGVKHVQNNLRLRDTDMRADRTEQSRDNTTSGKTA